MTARDHMGVKWAAPLLLAAASLTLASGAASGPTGCCREPPVYDSHPQWSPGGEWIAFARYTRSESRLRLFRVPASGGEVRQIAELSYGDHAYALSPDWSKVAFYDRGALTFMNLDGSDRHQVGSGIWSFDWSPDGDRLVFSAGQSKRNLFTVKADGSGLQPLGITGYDAVWSPDGSRLAFLDTDGLYVSNADGTGRRALYSLPAAPPSWSPDGERIAFVAGGVLFVFRQSGNEGLGIDGGFRPYRPEWSRNGALVAVPGDGGSSVVDLAQLTIRGLRGIQPVWSPTDDRLAFVDVEPCSPSGIHVLSPDGLARRRLTLKCQLVGTEHGDVLVGLNQKDLLFGLGGRDRLYGEGFEDQLFGGRGSDVLDGGDFGDVLEGGLGDDQLNGGNFRQDSYSQWDDFLYGGRGADDLRGGPGRDKLMGDAGGDVLRGGDDADVYFGGPGNDRIFAAGDPEWGFGHVRSDSIRCGRGRDVVSADRVDRVSKDCEVVRKTR